MQRPWMLLLLLAFPVAPVLGTPLPESLRAAVAAGDCRTARAVGREIRDEAFYGGRPELLFRAEEALAGVGGCGPWPWVELAVGFELIGKPVHGAVLLDSLAGAADDPVPFHRAHALFLDDDRWTLPASVLPSLPDSSGDPRWEAPEPRRLDAPDQVLSGGETWSGPDDAAVELRAGQVGGNLYLHLRVRDDEVRPGEDAVHVLLGRVGGGGLASRDPEGLSWVLAVPAEDAPRPGGVARVPKVWRTSVLRPDGYDLVICVPAGTLDLEFNTGSLRPFDLVLHDVDGEGTSVHRWCGRTDDPDDMRLAGILRSPD